MRGLSAAILVVAAFSVAGCATHAAQERTLNKWIGRSADDLIARAGPPEREYTLSDGRRVLEFQERYQDTAYSMSAPTTTRAPSTYQTTGTVTRDPLAPTPTYRVESETREQPSVTFNSSQRLQRTAVERECITRFVVGKDGRVTSWSTSGYC